MANAEKTAAVAEITDAFRTSSAAVLTEYRGLTVSQLTELRRALGAGTRYAVVKNTLTKIAAREAGVEGLDPLLEGPTAIAFVQGDPVEAARGVRDFSRTYPLLVVKGGVLDGRSLSADEVRKLADLESREVLLARLAGGFTASLARAAALFTAPLSQAARLAEALRAKAEQDPSVLSGGAGTPAPASAPAPVPSEESPVSDPESAAAADSATESATEPATEIGTTTEAGADVSTDQLAEQVADSTDPSSPGAGESGEAPVPSS